MFQKNLDFARNVAATTLDADRPDRPRNATEDEAQYQVKASPDIEPNRFRGVLRRPRRRSRRPRARILGPVDFVLQASSGPGRGEPDDHDPRRRSGAAVSASATCAASTTTASAPRVPADFVQPGTAQTPRPLVAGDVVAVRVIAGSQQQRFSYRVVSTRPASGAKRVLVVAAEDYTGLSPNKTPYDDRAALPRRARGRARRRTATRSRSTTSTTRRSAPKASRRRELVTTSACCRTSTPSSTTRATTCCRRRSARVLTAWNYRRGGTRLRDRHVLAHRAPSTSRTPGGPDAQMLRNYMNDGGKVIFTPAATAGCSRRAPAPA